MRRLAAMVYLCSTLTMVDLAFADIEGCYTMEDAASYYLMENGVDRYVLEGGGSCGAAPPQSVPFRLLLGVG